MKKIYGALMLVLIAFLMGCTKIEPTPFPTFDSINVKEDTAQDQTKEVTEDDLKKFFQKYFSLSDNDILMLNQKPSLVNDTYWDTYKIYKDKLMNLIGEYLTDRAKQKLKEAYMTYDFHLPKKLEMNGYVTISAGTVDDVTILASMPNGDNVIYQIAVTTRNEVESVSDANKKYEWLMANGYYVKLNNNLEDKKTFGTNSMMEQKTENSYLYLQTGTKDRKDAIKLVQQYWVEVKPGDTLAIESVKEASPIEVSQDTRQLASNTKHVTRVPYWKEVTVAQQNTIQKVIGQMINQQKDFYTYYEKAFNTNYDAYKLVWTKDLQLKNEVFLSPDSYKEAFNLTLNPYKDAVQSLQADRTQASIIPSVYATKKQPRFIVSIPVKAVLANNQVANYIYKYYIGMEQNKVEFIQFVNTENTTEASYTGEETQQTQSKEPVINE